MRMMIRKVHLWLTLPFGIFIVFLFLTGSILVFEKEVVTSAAEGGWVSACGWENPQPFFKTTRQLHRWLLDNPSNKTEVTVGRAVVGISAIVTCLILLSGLVLWLPQKLQTLKMRFRLTTGKGALRFWYGWHALAGICCVWFLLLMALTGPAWTFAWYRNLWFGLLPQSDAPMKVILSLHTGTWGGLTTQLLYFLAALAGATLVVSGYYLAFKRMKSQRRK